MPAFRRATVSEVLGQRRGLQRVGLVGGDRAHVLTELTGPVAVGDDVIVNTTAVDLGLGTGGWHVVHWNLARDTWAEPGPGHIMKLRYTSLQVDTGAAEEAHPDVATGLDGTPVVACGLHSQVSAVAAVVKHLRPDARVSYVMTDGAALPMALSDLVVAMADAGVVDATITAGHAFGGDLEAVGVASALTLARHVQRADVVIVAMGPGVVGTGSRLGTTALEVAPVLDTAAWLGGSPVLCLRASDADPRRRHQGISHHSLTALDAVRSGVTVALADDERPDALPDVDGRHRVEMVAVPDVGPLLAAAGLRVTTMGRGPEDERRFFAAAGAAGVVAAGLAIGLGPGS